MVGRTISHYEVVEKLAEGGMGVVYCARDLRLDRLVALKILPSEHTADPTRRERFVREAKAASALNHPNIITIYDIETVDGVDYIAMEYVRGSTLSELIPPTGLDLALALNYASQIATGLAAAHSAGIVHRDIKPANIMVTQSGLVKLLDFGLALIEQAVFDQTTSASTVAPAFITRAGAVLGTVAYMSPEQARGKEVDQRSDIFSFGIVLYQMLTGALPFQASSEVGLMYEIIHTPSPAAGEIRSDLPPALEHVLRTSLAKDPPLRYARIEDVVNDLKDVTQKLESGVPPREIAGGREPGRKQDRPKAVIAGVAVCLLLLLAPVLWKMSPRWLAPVPAEKKIAVLPFRNVGGVHENEAFCDGIMEALTSELTELSQFRGSLWVVPATEVRREGLASAKDAQRALGVNLVITGSIQRDASQVRLTANVVDAATQRQLRSREIHRPVGEVADLQEVMIQEVAGMLQLELGARERQALAARETEASAAYDLYLQAHGHLQRRNSSKGDLDLAIQMFQKAVALDPKYTLAYAGLGEAYWKKYRDTHDTQWVQPAETSCQRALALNQQLAPVHLTFGIIKAGTGHHEEAIAELNKAIALEPSNAAAYGELGAVYETTGRLAEAESNFKKATELRPGDWTSFNDAGRFYFRQGRYQEAIPLFRKITELAPDHSSGYTNLGSAFWMNGQLEDAATKFQKSLTLRPTASAYSSLGTVYFFLDRCAEAVPLMEKAAELSPKNEQVWGNLGDVYACVPQKKSDAARAYRRAVELGQERLAVNSNDAEVLSVMALYQAKLGNKKESVANIKKASQLAPGNRKVAWEAAVIYELGGDRDRALEALQVALRSGQPVEEVLREPALAKLRNDPRYATLMAAK